MESIVGLSVAMLGLTTLVMAVGAALQAAVGLGLALFCPGDVYHITPEPDSWVVGGEPYVSLHFLGADQYADRH
jgi:hypothetical protein